VRARTALINSVRGSLRTHGYRMGSCTSEGFTSRFGRLKMKRELRQALDPLVETVAELTARIERLERELEEEARSDELLVRLQDVPGVGPLVSLAFVAWMDRPERFARSRDVGACLGLRPKIRDSGDRQRRGPITREGDPEMRRLLVQAAHASLRCLKDSALKRWAQRLELRAGKRKMAVALARKIAVLLHRLWVTGDTYRHFPATT
jgi:transposase